MALLFLLAIVAVIAFRLTTGEHRKEVLRKAAVVLGELVLAVREEYARLDPFRAALRRRTKYAIVTAALVAVNVVLFMSMLMSAGAWRDPSILIGWGASFGPRTTNGEWWRLLTATLVHMGFIRMVVEVAALAQLGMLLERLTGRATFAAVYCAGGVLAGLVNVSTYPMAVTSGSSGAVFGLYGLLLASIVRSVRARPSVDAPAVIEPSEVAAETGIERGTAIEDAAEDATEAATQEAPAILVVPRSALLWQVPAFVLFVLSALSNDGFAFEANMAGLGAGTMAGVALTGGIAHRPPQPRRVLVAAAVIFVALAALAVPLRGIADVRPEISRILALEDKTSGTYRAALDRVNKRAMTPDSLAQLIERSIVPELEAADAHLMSIKGVPPEHRALVADADEYLRLRSASWRLYAESWRNKVRAPHREADGVLTSDATWHQLKAKFRADAATRGKAEGTERASLEILQRLKPSS